MDSGIFPWRYSHHTYFRKNIPFHNFTVIVSPLYPHLVVSPISRVHGRDGTSYPGAHTVGACHAERSGFEGAWTDDKLKFDNAYFKDLLNKNWSMETVSGFQILFLSPFFSFIYIYMYMYVIYVCLYVFDLYIYIYMCVYAFMYLFTYIYIYHYISA